MRDVDFSIVIPTYNNLPLFQNALKSVRNQEGVDIEIIVVDDSNSNEIEVYVQSLNDQRIIYRHNNPSLGAVPNWNFGLSLVHGKHVILLHHDEAFIDKCHLKKILIRFAEGYKIVISNIEIIKGNDYVEHGNYNSILKRIFILFPTLLFIANLIGPCACVAFKKDEMLPFDERLHWLVDVEWYYRILSHNKRIYLPKLFIRSQHGHADQISQSINIRKFDLEDYSILKTKYKSRYALIICLLLEKMLGSSSCIKRSLKKIFK